MTFNPLPINLKDAAGTTQPCISYTDGTNNALAHPLLDSTGAIISPATAANQATGNASLATIVTNTANIPAKGSNTSANSIPVVIATDQAGLPLPTGASTSALQTSGNTSLATIATNSASIVTNTTSIATAANQATMVTSLAAIATSVAAATPAGTNTIGSVSMAANTSGGASTYAATGGTGNALLTNTPVAVKTSAGNLYGIDFVNTGATAAYVQLFDLASGSVTLGTSIPKMVKWVPAGGAWEEKFTGETKIAFATAITVAATSTPTGSTAPSSGILANIVYK